jgi:transposase
MKPTKLLQDIRQMRFEEAHDGWREGRLTQEEAARLLGVCERSFRRYINRYEERGLEGLADKRLEQMSHRKAPVDEVMALMDRYKSHYHGWNVKHFFRKYREEGGGRSYSWVKNSLQAQGVVTVGKSKGKHRTRRERRPLPGMMIHQDGSTHQWIEGQYWDLIVTMDDATNEHYSMFFVAQEGTLSSLRGVQEVIEKQGIFSSFYSDRGSHYWHTPEVGGKVDKGNPTQFGRAMKQLGIEMIAAYSPQARGRSERMFRTHQDRLVKELALHQITDMDAANRYLNTEYLPRFNAEFQVAAAEAGSAFVPYVGTGLADILCEQHERQVGHDNCVQFEKRRLQIPADRHRMHYVKTTVRVHRYADHRLAVFHGPRRLADYDAQGQLQRAEKTQQQAA